ncbi:MAG TPA: C4-dicarboxylate ABC transporter [Ruegeria sp.]|nr:C4-dicarboxylate ABC transporter [Ruegeria sp.]
MDVVLLFVMVVGFLLIGVPIAVALGFSSVLFLLIFSDSSLASVAQTLFQAFEGHFTLLAIPFFILASSFMTTGGVAQRIIRFAIACVGHLRGGLAISGVFACMMFAALSGSSPATVVAIGSIVIAAMKQAGYTKEFAAGVICNAGTLGILIPPSIAYIIIGLVLGISASTLFLAALIPGLCILISILVTNVVMNRINGWEGGGNISAGEYFGNLGRSLKSGWYAFIVPGIIFYGIFSGRLTPTEAGATAVVVTVLMGFILRTLSLSDFPAMLVSSAKVNGVILPIIAFSAPLAEALAIMGVPQGFVAAVTGMTDEPWLLILLMIGILIAAGCVMETTPNIVILAPILKPLADNIGMNEIQFCIMMITALGVGFITPPLGLNLFVVSGITGESILKIAARAVPFVLFMLLVVLLIAYLPAISTTLLPDIYK